MHNAECRERIAEYLLRDQVCRERVRIAEERISRESQGDRREANKPAAPEEKPSEASASSQQKEEEREEMEVDPVKWEAFQKRLENKRKVENMREPENLTKPR
eukprot:5300358-Karenia_brevis.AAC.1